MKTVYIDCSMGAAGDMLTAALSELLPNADAFFEKMNHIGLHDVVYEKQAAVKCGITGTHISVKVHGVEEGEHQHEHEHSHSHEHEHDHNHDHDHAHDHGHEEHTHSHVHRSMHDIQQIVEGLSIDEAVKKDVLAVYARIAEAESHAHGRPVSEIHFHEVGTMDAVADVTAVCMLMHEIAPQKVVVSPVHVGAGHVHCAHGILPVPAPATAYILKGCPIYGGGIKSELCTPTGAALLVHFATEFGQMPAMRVSSIGYGMGKKDFQTANCVRVMLGEAQSALGSEDLNTVTELRCNIDDMTAEELGFAMERLFAEGALEVYTVPVTMKKSRPGHILHVICENEDKDKMVTQIFKYTTTIGMREYVTKRYGLKREIRVIETPYGTVREKVSSGYGVSRGKYEYEDISRIAREQHMNLAQVRKIVDDAK